MNLSGLNFYTFISSILLIKRDVLFIMTIGNKGKGNDVEKFISIVLLYLIVFTGFSAIYHERNAAFLYSSSVRP